MAGCRFDQFLSRYRIAGIQHYTVEDGPKQSKVFKAHLRGPVLSDGYPGVRTHKLDVAVRILTHPDLVKSATQEGGKSGNERQLAPVRNTDRCSHHVLFCDIHLEESLRVSFLESRRHRRIANFTIQADNRWKCGINANESVAEGISRSNGLAQRVIYISCRLGFDCFRKQVFRFLYFSSYRSVNFSQFRERPFKLIPLQGHSVPAILIFQERNSFPFDGFGNDHQRLARDVQCLMVSLQNFRERVSVDGNGFPPKSRNPLGIGREIMSVHRCSALPQTVYVENPDEVVQLVVRRDLQGLPLRAFSHFAVPQKHVRFVRKLVEIFPANGHADPDGEALPERAGSRFGISKGGRGMAFKGTAEFPIIRQEILFRQLPGRRPQSIKKR